MSTKRILDHLANADIIDGIDENRNTATCAKNISDILSEEVSKENSAVTCIKYTTDSLQKKEKKDSTDTMKNILKKVSQTKVAQKA
jgi:hypothetical protein